MATGQISVATSDFDELDSMAVATLLTAIEERLGILLEDDDVEAEDFATYGSLLAFARRKALQ
jgi:acyl carrier protein